MPYWAHSSVNTSGKAHIDVIYILSGSLYNNEVEKQRNVPENSQEGVLRDATNNAKKEVVKMRTQTGSARHLKRALSLVLSMGLVLALSLSFLLTGCGILLNGDSDRSDSDATAGDTFGDAFDSLDQDGTLLVNTIPLQTGAEIYALPDFIQLALRAKDGFIGELSVALQTANLQQTPETVVVQMDTIAIIDVFEILTACQPGNPETMVKWWRDRNPGNPWTYDYAEDDTTTPLSPGYFQFDLLLLANDTPYCEFVGRWFESEQYLYAIYLTTYSRLEIDVVRTGDGWAIQTYEPSYATAYRMSFTHKAPYNGGVGVCYNAFSEQPRTLSSGETLGFATEWPELGNIRQTAYFQLMDESLYVTSYGDDAEMTYTVRPDFAQTSAEEAKSLKGSGSAIVGTELSAEATQYIGMWHASSILGAGWNERFVLYGDGAFIWGANEMDGSARLRYLSGYWDVKDGRIILDCRVAIYWEGGQEVTNEGLGGYSSSTVIINPTLVVYSIEETQSMPLSRITTDNTRGLSVATFNTLKCWNYSDQYSEGPGGPIQGYFECLQAANSQSGTVGDKDRGSESPSLG